MNNVTNSRIISASVKYGKYHVGKIWQIQSNLDITARLGVGCSGRYTELAVISKFSSNDNFSNRSRISYTVCTCDASTWAYLFRQAVKLINQINNI